MPDAHRKIIEEAKAAITGLTTTGDNVFEDPTYALALGNLPAVAVEPEDEISERLADDFSEGFEREAHTLGLIFHCLGRTPAERDEISIEVKRAVILYVPLGRDRRYVRANFTRSRAGEQDLYTVSLRIDVEYDVIDGEPDQIV
jgi:hypothetical protein